MLRNPFSSADNWLTIGKWVGVVPSRSESWKSFGKSSRAVSSGHQLSCQIGLITRGRGLKSPGNHRLSARTCRKISSTTTCYAAIPTEPCRPAKAVAERITRRQFRASENFGPNFGPLAPEHHRKPRSTRDQRARQINKIENLTKSAKPDGTVSPNVPSKGVTGRPLEAVTAVTSCSLQRLMIRKGRRFTGPLPRRFGVAAQVTLRPDLRVEFECRRYTVTRPRSLRHERKRHRTERSRGRRTARAARASSRC